MTSDEKKIVAALKQVLAPLLIGLRNDNEELLKALNDLVAKEGPDVQKTTVENLPEPISEVTIKNPVEEVTIKNPQEMIRVQGLTTKFANLFGIFAGLSKGINNITKGITRLRRSTLKVEVQNQTDIEPLLEALATKIVKGMPKRKQVERTFIENSAPNEAIPVVLTTADRKRFYTAISQMITGGANLGNVKTALNDIKTLIADLSKAEDSVHTSGDKGIMGLGVRNDALTPLAADGDYIPPMFNDKGELVVAATVTGIEVVTDVRSLVQKLADTDKVFSSLGFNLTVASNLEEDVFLITNPVGSGITLKIKDFLINTVRASQSMVFIVYRNPTITANGTTITPVNFRDTSVAATGKTFSIPTISSRGTKFEVFGVAGATELRHQEFLALQLLEGDSILVTVDEGNNNQDFSLGITFAEE